MSGRKILFILVVVFFGWFLGLPIARGQEITIIHFFEGAILAVITFGFLLYRYPVK